MIVVAGKVLLLKVKNGNRKTHHRTACMIHKSWLSNRIAFSCNIANRMQDAGTNASLVKVRYM